MKNSKILYPLLFVSFFIGNGCRKDELLLSHLSNYSRLNIMDAWNDTQRKFFNLGNSALRIRDLNSSHTHNRTSGFTIVDSTFTRFYNKLVSIDQQSDLSGKISNHVGFPIWQFVIIFDNQAGHTATMYLPLGFETGSKTEAIITGIEFEENGVKKYSFKLTERAEIQEVLDNESKLSKYNNFAMEAIYFIYSDYYIFQDNYQPFVDRLIQMQENGLDLHTGQSTDILNINKKTKGTRSECRCELRVGEFLIDGEGNIIKEFKNNGLTPGGPGNGAGTGGGGNGGGNGDGNNHTQGGGGFEGLWHGTGIPPGGETFNDIYIVIFGWEFIGWYNNNNNNFNEPEPESGAGGGELLFAYVRLKPKRPVIKGPDQTETRNGEETIIIQNFIDCGQDGFTADDLLVGDLKEGNTIMGMIESSDLDCATSKCMLANIPLFDKVEEFLSQSYIDPCTGEDVISEQDLNDAIHAACSGDGRHAAMTFSAQINELLEEAGSCSNCDYTYVKCDNKEDGICPETFILQNVGAGYTCQVNNVQFNYVDVSGTGTNRIMTIGDICIQISGRDKNGNSVLGDSNDMLSEAWNIAQFLTATEFAAVGHTLSSAQYKQLFINNLRLAIAEMFSSSSIATGKCLGNIVGNKPKYSIFCN